MKRNKNEKKTGADSKTFVYQAQRNPYDTCGGLPDVVQGPRTHAYCGDSAEIMVYDFSKKQKAVCIPALVGAIRFRKLASESSYESRLQPGRTGSLKKGPVKLGTRVRTYLKKIFDHTTESTLSLQDIYVCATPTTVVLLLYRLLDDHSAQYITNSTTTAEEPTTVPSFLALFRKRTYRPFLGAYTGLEAVTSTFSRDQLYVGGPLLGPTLICHR